MTGNRIDENMQLHHEESAAPDAETASGKMTEERNASMLSLFNNLPASAFAKCVETGRYLACNQAFAASVHKNSPAEVVGLTDDDLYDEKTADQMKADDRMVLSMDEPCVLYEDVLDASGAARRLRVTKQKFVDESGRSCLMGLSVDVTEIKGMRREAAQAQDETNTTDSWEKANKDALTGVKNKHSFDSYTEKFQRMIDQGELPEVAIGAFDCDNLGKINEQYGHEKGNQCLMASCRLICKVFKHSPVFRVGGDEFAVILQGEDYHNLDGLLQQFQEMQNEIDSSAKRPWEKVRVSFGIAVYCPRFDGSVKDLIHRADQLMRDNKPEKKA